ncbi:dipeptide epimerase [Congregibacter litoralis]|uniref:Dipeptide epimerase n=1 Tax=Congregibacter litoralis KT71 TaxID=314285 RepID=A4AD98_9GAMM|nr:dipeptide epimerase [Congregibacter litoralis]EAQ96022.1 L-alanine-DL-glutamate epimerase [Congregibacter litoralis KT71]
MKMTVDIVSYPMEVPFAITGHVFHDTDTVRVSLEHEGVIGRGESVGSYYLNETAASMKAELEAIIGHVDATTTPESLQDLMPLCGARCALDCALWDLRAKRAGKRIWELLDITPQEVTTVFTVGMEDVAVMAERAAAAKRFPQLKIKLNDDKPIERLEAIRAARPDATLVIDVNQGWSFEALKDYLPACEKLGIAMIEQPLPRGEDAALAGFKSPVPLGADESCLGLDEFDQAAERYDVLNIKLDKCGGLTEGLALVRAAQSRDMQIMVGNMTGTSLSMAPSYVIAQFCQFVDIDGPLLLARDIENGLEYRSGGSVGLPSAALWG